MEKEFRRNMNVIDGQARELEPVTIAMQDFLRGQSNGLYELLLRLAKKPKSYQQVKMIFGLMIEQTIVQANDLGIDVSGLLKYLLDESLPKGQGLTKDFLIELSYIICPTTDAEGRRITLSKMSTVQAANLFERYRNIMAPIGIVIPDPNIEWRTASTDGPLK